MDNFEKIDVLDCGFVRKVEIMGSDLTVVNAARVSFAKESNWDVERNWKLEIISKELSDKDKKLIKYLAEHKHWTPFAHPQIMLHIKAPVSIRTQLFKHKVGFVENEISRRYVSETPDVYIPNWRSRPSNGAKQGSGDFIIDENIRLEQELSYRDSVKEAIKTYEQLLANGVAPEQARFVLPQGTYTEFVWTGSLYAFARIYNLRIDAHAQWEIQEYAKAIDKIIAPLFPVSWQTLTTK